MLTSEYGMVLVSLLDRSQDVACRVSGTVTLDDAPLPDGLVIFLPDKSVPSMVFALTRK